MMWHCHFSPFYFFKYFLLLIIKENNIPQTCNNIYIFYWIGTFFENWATLLYCSIFADANAIYFIAVWSTYNEVYHTFWSIKTKLGNCSFKKKIVLVLHPLLPPRARILSTQCGGITEHHSAWCCAVWKKYWRWRPDEGHRKSKSCQPKPLPNVWSPYTFHNVQIIPLHCIILILNMWTIWETFFLTISTVSIPLNGSLTASRGSN